MTGACAPVFLLSRVNLMVDTCGELHIGCRYRFMSESTPVPPAPAPGGGEAPKAADAQKKQTVRISLPPKPSAGPAIKIPAAGAPAAKQTMAIPAPPPATPGSAPAAAAAPAAPKAAPAAPPPAPAKPAAPARPAAPAVSGIDLGLAIAAVVVGIAAVVRLATVIN